MRARGLARQAAMDRKTASGFERSHADQAHIRLPPAVASKLADYATQKRVPQALVVETALCSYLSPDGSERLEAALGRRLDRLGRQMERVERNLTISHEALALFVRFWLTATPQLPDTALRAAQATDRNAMTATSRRWCGVWQKDRRWRKSWSRISMEEPSDLRAMINPDRHRARRPTNSCIAA